MNRANTAACTGVARAFLREVPQLHARHRARRRGAVASKVRRAPLSTDPLSRVERRSMDARRGAPRASRGKRLTRGLARVLAIFNARPPPPRAPRFGPRSVDGLVRRRSARSMSWLPLPPRLFPLPYVNNLATNIAHRCEPQGGEVRRAALGSLTITQVPFRNVGEADLACSTARRVVRMSIPMQRNLGRARELRGGQSRKAPVRRSHDP